MRVYLRGLSERRSGRPASLSDNRAEGAEGRQQRKEQINASVTSLVDGWPNGAGRGRSDRAKT